MRRNDPNRGGGGGGFTLVELILVMALLATLLAFSAPTLSRSFHNRHLRDEGTRFVALTEYARDEAVSQGVPMVVWIDPQAGRFGVQPKTGYDGNDARRREYPLNADVRVEVASKSGTGGGNQVIEAVELSPEGTPTVASTESVRLVDRFNAVLTIARTADGWGYEIVKEAR